MLKFVSLFFLLSFSTFLFSESVPQQKHLFIFFYKEKNNKTTQMQKAFETILQKFGDRAQSKIVNIKDPAEKTLVDRYDLKRSPMPFVLVLAPNGAVTGGFPYTFTEQQLTDAFTSPGMAQCIKGLQDRKLVILSLQNNRTLQNEAALAGVKDFLQDPQYSSATELVMMDPSNPQEQKFLQQLAIDPSSKQALTVLIAPPAEVIGKYPGATTKSQFITDIQKASSGCCPGGCCPGGCCPGGKCAPKK